MQPKAAFIVATVLLSQATSILAGELFFRRRWSLFRGATEYTGHRCDGNPHKYQLRVFKPKQVPAGNRAAFTGIMLIPKFDPGESLQSATSLAAYGMPHGRLKFGSGRPDGYFEYAAHSWFDGRARVGQVNHRTPFEAGQEAAYGYCQMMKRVGWDKEIVPTFNFCFAEEMADDFVDGFNSGMREAAPEIMKTRSFVPWGPRQSGLTNDLSLLEPKRPSQRYRLAALHALRNRRGALTLPYFQIDRAASQFVPSRASLGGIRFSALAIAVQNHNEHRQAVNSYLGHTDPWLAKYDSNVRLAMQIERNSAEIGRRWQEMLPRQVVNFAHGLSIFMNPLGLGDISRQRAAAYEGEVIRNSAIIRARLDAECYQ